MAGLFPEGTFKPEDADRPWTDADTDRMFDLFFAGCPPKRMALKLGRTPKSINVRLAKFARNERNMAEEYKPRKRKSRDGERWTENESRFLRPLRNRHGMSNKVIGRLLARSPETLPQGGQQAQPKPRKKARAPIDVRDIDVATDILLAHRFLYYVKATPVLSDCDYDRLEKETLANCSKQDRRVIEMVGSDNADDYPNHIRGMASYLIFKYRGGGTVG